ncbi:MAG: hypothetical protein GX620_13150 [Chloroflexi bacterium]|nr:hypothetical protein [Chloroflexota bacterium]
MERRSAARSERGCEARESRCVTAIGLALIALVAATPFFGTGIPRTNDALPHLYRAFALSRLVDWGQLWPRWFPDLVHGYGYPVGNYFPLLAHLAVVALHQVGLGITTAYRLVGTGQFVLAAWFAYLLGRDEFGPMGGWVAAVGYVTSPYLLYDAHVRGSLPESLALSWLPLLILAIRRAAISRGRWLGLVAMAVAAMMLSHHGILLQILIVLGAWLLWLGYRLGWEHLVHPIAGLLLGGLLSAFFWLPAVAEAGWIQSDVAIGQGYSFRANFLSLPQLVSWPRLPADPSLLNPPVVRSLPFVPLIIAAFALPGRWRCLTLRARKCVVGWVIVLCLSVAMTTVLTRPIWEVLRPLQLTFYPWRFLGPASLAAAMMAGASFTEVRAGRGALLALCGFSAAVLVATAGWLYPPREDVSEDLAMADLMAFEHPPLFIGTTTLGEFLPLWVDKLPDTSDLRDELAAGEAPDRLTVPPNAHVEAQPGNRVTDATYRVELSGETVLTYRQFYFPGWSVTLDGVLWPTESSAPHGLLQFTVPAGQHVVQVRLGSTIARRLGWALSALGLVMLLMVRGRRPRRLAGQCDTPMVDNVSLAWWWVILLAFGFLGGKLLLDQVDTPLRRPLAVGDTIHGVDHTEVIDLTGDLRMLGYDQSHERFPADATVTITPYWRPSRPIGVVYDRVIQVVDSEGLVWSAGDAARPTDWRFAPGTDAWTPDHIIMDPFVLTMKDGTPPGEYRFRVALVRRDTHQTVAEVDFGQLTISHAGRGEHQPDPSLTVLDGAALPGVHLIAAGIDRQESAPGDPVSVSLLWQVIDPRMLRQIGDEGATFHLRLVARDGSVLWTDEYAIARNYPLEEWRAGDRLRTQLVLRIPSRVPDGVYGYEVGMAASRFWAIGTIALRNPERTWEAPRTDVSVDAALWDAVGPVASLVGADLDAVGAPLSPPADLNVTLVWRAEDETEVSYRVFLHLIDGSGHIVAQSDGEPAAWRRPTTGWLPGEYVFDSRVLSMGRDTPDGQYTICAGLYDVHTGLRLTTLEGHDRIAVSRVVVARQ